MTIEDLNYHCKDTLIEHLGIEFIEIGKGFVKATMPIDNRTHQPQKRLHGGATMALAETIGGAASMTLVNNPNYAILGVDINGTHVGSTEENYVIGEATVIYHGKSTHVCDVRVKDQHGHLISICRITNRIIPIKK
jgi:1,4-dihydroxy-2-naphthoyl-CoA hydrolase